MHKKCVDKEKIRSSVKRMTAKYAERSIFCLNPDEVVVENIIAGLARNKMKYGYAYCPCREVKGIPEMDRNNICPCKTHKEEITTQEICECGLFVSKSYLKARKQMSS